MDVRLKNFFLFKHYTNDKIEKFFHSLIFFALEAIPFLIAWLTKSLLVASIFSILFCLVIYLFSDDGTLFAPLAFFYVISFSTFPNNNQVPLQIYICLGVYFFIIILFIIKRLILHIPLRFSTGGNGLSLFILAIILTISLIFQSILSPSVYQKYGLLYYLYLMAYVFIFFLLTSIGIKGYSNTLRNTFIVLDIAILFEILYATIANYVSTDKMDLIFNLGWGNKNVVVILMECCLPFLLIGFKENYISFKKKKHVYISNILILLLLFVNLILILSSDSRGGMITTIVLTPLICYLIVPNFSIKKRLLWTVINLVAFMLLALIVYLTIPSVKDSIDLLIDLGNNLSGREKIWEQVIIIFHKNPILGGGPTSLFEINAVAFGTPSNASSVNMMLCHNTIYTMLALGGILGVIGYILWNLESIYCSYSLSHNLKVAIFYFIAFGFIHGLIDNTFMSPSFMFPALLIFTNGDILGFKGTTKLIKENIKKKKQKNE